MSDAVSGRQGFALPFLLHHGGGRTRFGGRFCLEEVHAASQYLHAFVIDQNHVIAIGQRHEIHLATQMGLQMMR